MRITNRLLVNSFSANLGRGLSDLYKTSNQITSGRRINRPSDDPVGTARSMFMNTSLTQIDQYKTNSKTAETWMNSTDSALTSANSYLQRVYKLVVEGASDSTTNDSRAAMAEEIDRISDGLMDIANSNIDNRYLFSGEKVLNQSYSLRALVGGDARDLAVNPIKIDLRNCQFKLKLDNGITQTITLSPKVYDGTDDHTLDDLVGDIQNQLKSIGYDVPVYVKVNNENQLEFYAGAKPPDGKTHTLVLKEGSAIKETGYAVEISTVPPPNQIGLSPSSNAVPNFYSGWTVSIIGGKGLGQSRTISTYTGGAGVPPFVANLTTNWYQGLEPDETSVYSIVPPLEGKGSVTLGTNTIQLDSSGRSGLNDFYNGMEITLTNSSGFMEKRRIIDYDGATGIATLDGPDWGSSTDYDYTITPHLAGTAAGPGTGSNTIVLDPVERSQIANFYSGASITVTHSNGAVETRKITGYNAGTGQVTVDSQWNFPIDAQATYKISDTALQQLGFENKATTKELVGVKLEEPILVLGQYPLTGKARTAGVNEIGLADDCSSTADYYKNWTVKIISGTGAGQTATIQGYDGVNKVAVINGSLTLGPDSVYSLDPPSNGGVAAPVSPATAQAGTNITVTLANSAVTTDDYYKGWTITITGGAGAGQTIGIQAYDGRTKTVTVDPPGFGVAPDATSQYVLNPPLSAPPIINSTAQNAGAGFIQLDLASSGTDGTYVGWTVTLPGTGQTGTITAYTGATQTANVVWNPPLPAPAGAPQYVLAPPVPADTATAGTANSIGLALSSSARDNCYNGWTINIISGAGAGQSRTITNYNGTSKVAGVDADWTIQPDATSVYTLTPPAPATDQIRLNQAAVGTKDFYVGMPITITDGTGKGQTRTIVAYNEESQVATLDSSWNTIPDFTSKYSIDTHYNNNALNKFRITVGSSPTQEIDLDGGSYSAAEFAEELQSKIQSRGGDYANVRVYLTADKELKIRYEDPDPDDNDAPLNIKLESGSTADILWKMGFSNGIYSEKPTPNYEGDKGISEYEVNLGITIPVNEIGQTIFDPVFEHLAKISMDLRAGNTSALGSDITNIQDDIERVLIAQGRIGAKVNRMNKAVDRLDVLNENVQDLLSRIEDVDVAEIIMRYQMRQAAYQAALQVGAKILPPSLLDYMR